MFRINIPITKSFQKSLDVLVIEGIASDSTIDRDEERFTEEAVKSMHDSVNSSEIPIRVEHEDKIFSEVGVWKEATMTEDNKLFVKGEIDLNMSMGKDIQVLLSKGVEISLSVGGLVKEVLSEFNESLGKSIKVYKDIILKEISVVKHPSNYNASLSIAKSFDFTKNIESEEGFELTKKSLEIEQNIKTVEKQPIVEEIIKNEQSELINIMEKCVMYKMNKGLRPQSDGNDLSDVEINKLAKAHSIFIDRGILKSNSDITMTREQILAAIAAANIAKSEAEETIATLTKSIEVEVEVTPVEEIVEPVVEEVVETPVVAEDTVLVEEACTETTKNNNGTDETLLNAVKALLEANNEALVKSFDEKLALMAKSKEEEVVLAKSVSYSNEEVSKMQEALEALSNKVKSYDESASSRKSQAVAIAKGYESKEESTLEKSISERMEAGLSFSQARTAALSKGA